MDKKNKERETRNDYNTYVHGRPQLRVPTPFPTLPQRRTPSAADWNVPDATGASHPSLWVKSR